MSAAAVQSTLRLETWQNPWATLNEFDTKSFTDALDEVTNPDTGLRYVPPNPGPDMLRQLEKELSEIMQALGGWHEIDGSSHYIYTFEPCAKALDKLRDIILRYPLQKRRQIMGLICDLKLVPDHLAPILETKYNHDVAIAKRILRIMVLLTDPIVKRGFENVARTLEYQHEWNTGDEYVRNHLANLQSIKEDLCKTERMSAVCDMLINHVGDGVEFGHDLLRDFDAEEQEMRDEIEQTAENENDKKKKLHYMQLEGKNRDFPIVTDCLLLFRNLVAIPDPKPGDPGYTDNRRYLQLKFVKMYAKLELMPLLNTWAGEEFPMENNTRKHSDLTFRDRFARWVIFDLIYYMITKLSPAEIIEVEGGTKRDLLADYLKKDKAMRAQHKKSSIKPRHGGFGVSTSMREHLKDRTLQLEKEASTKARVPLKKQFGGMKQNTKKDIVTTDVLFQDLAPAVGELAEHNRSALKFSGNTLAESLDPTTLATTREWLNELMDCHDSFTEQGQKAEEEDHFPVSKLMQFMIQEIQTENAKIQEMMKINPEMERLDENDNTPGKNPFLNYHTKSRVMNFVAFFLEYYRLFTKAERKKNKQYDVAPQVIQGLVDIDTQRYLVDQLQKEGKENMINPDRLILVLRACLEQMRIIGDCCKIRDRENRALGYVLVENLIGRNIAQRLIEVIKLYKPMTHEARVLSYSIEALHYCLLLMEEVTDKDTKEPKVFMVIKYGNVQTEMKITDYTKALCDWTIIQNLLTMLERYHHTNEMQLYFTCKMLRRIISAHPSNIALFFNLRFFARMEKIIKSDFVVERPEMFRDLHHLFKLILHEFLKCYKDNKLAITELLLNLTTGRDELTGSYENWDGILKNYETAVMKKKMEDMVINKKTYDEMKAELKQAKLDLKHNERKWTEEEEKELKEKYLKYKDTSMTQQQLLHSIYGDMDVEELSITKKDIRLRLIGLNLIDPPKKLTIEDLAEKCARFFFGTTATIRGVNSSQSNKKAQFEYRWRMLEKIRKKLKEVTQLQTPITFDQDFAMQEPGFRNSFIDILKCLNASRVTAGKNKKSNTAAVETQVQLDTMQVEDDLLEDSTITFKLPFKNLEEAKKNLRELNKLLTYDEKGLQGFADAAAGRIR
ncbi:unnamed protein product [Amoebophrya sp. A120]|nr:unnamed protein product [Amoebophrya sp. A120]|eukprot:GSA120T00020478001.1